MITIDSKEFRGLVGQAVIQRGLGSNEIAAKIFEDTMEHFDQPAKEIALLQLIYIYEDVGNIDMCKKYASELAEYDPEIPSVKKVLSKYR